MTPTVDPVWPWSLLAARWPGGAVTVAAMALAAGAATYAVPVLRGGADAPRRRRLLRAALVAGGMVAVWALLGVFGGSGGAAARAAELGLAALLAVPLLLAGLTLWSYAGVPGATGRRIGVVLGLRLVAFLLAVLALVRPSLGVPDKDRLPTRLYVLVDHSASMSIRDEIDGRSRWEHLLRTLREAGPALERLRDQGGVEVAFAKFAREPAEFSPDNPGEPDGKETDFGTALRRLYEGRDGRRPPRGLLVLSDGADHGTKVPALTEAVRWRALPCPVHPFAYGKPTTNDRTSDVAITDLVPEPAPVPVKGELTARVRLDAYGFTNQEVRVKLFLEGRDGKRREVASDKATLRLTTGNEVRVKCTAPAEAGEVKLTAAVTDPGGGPLSGDTNTANNEMSTYVTVTKEGISVLLVDKPRAFEPAAVADALAVDPRVRVYTVWLGGDRPTAARAGDLFRFDTQQYDVVLLGDVSAAQVEAVRPGAVAAIAGLVDKGAGLMVVGGFATYDKGGWPETPLKDVLPVDIAGGDPGQRGQVSTPVKMEPTEPGLRLFSYLLRLGDKQSDPRKAWEKLYPLEGMTRMGPPRPNRSNVLAVAGNGGGPILVAGNYGGGRVLAFGGDTTHRWIRDEETKAMHARFWRQAVVWLAHQEEAEGGAWVKPGTRRLPARAELPFEVGLKGKGGVRVEGAAYEVEVSGPGGVKFPARAARTADGDRGTFTQAEAPGEYKITVRGKGKDAEGNEVGGEASARFLVYDDDRELTDRAAGHEFLQKLAAAGGGEFHRGDELRGFLEDLLNRPGAHDKPRLVLVPDWRATGRSPFLVGFFLLFVAVLTAEWVLRRRWGLV